MADVFLSYAREDRAKAEQIAQALGSAGYDVFWDIEIPPGASWADFLAEKLSQSKAALVLWSTTSTSSQWVREEARLARDRGKLIPVMIEECAPPFGFGEIQAANLASWNGEADNPHWKLLLEGIQRAV
ncbi:MAG: toll/interleukin-1 receptor domain-containing protein, partial [Alphaproteobacteria bacterium]|nr:toll/interleukin-1 receptor domain-containing protein [Alphaproteobacteria bacterium]